MIGFTISLFKKNSKITDSENMIIGDLRVGVIFKLQSIKLLELIVRCHDKRVTKKSSHIVKHIFEIFDMILIYNIEKLIAQDCEQNFGE